MRPIWAQSRHSAPRYKPLHQSWPRGRLAAAAARRQRGTASTPPPPQHRRHGGKRAPNSAPKPAPTRAAQRRREAQSRPPVRAPAVVCALLSRADPGPRRHIGRNARTVELHRARADTTHSARREHIPRKVKTTQRSRMRHAAFRPHVRERRARAPKFARPTGRLTTGAPERGRGNCGVLRPAGRARDRQGLMPSPHPRVRRVTLSWPSSKQDL